MFRSAGPISLSFTLCSNLPSTGKQSLRIPSWCVARAPLSPGHRRQSRQGPRGHHRRNRAGVDLAKQVRLPTSGLDRRKRLGAMRCRRQGLSSLPDGPTLCMKSTRSAAQRVTFNRLRTRRLRNPCPQSGGKAHERQVASCSSALADQCRRYPQTFHPSVHVRLCKAPSASINTFEVLPPS